VKGERAQPRGTRRAKARAAHRRSPLTALIVALSLIIQLFAVPYHQASAAPGFAEPETARIAAELRATFGDAAALCVETDSKGAPLSPVGHCDDQCPLCRFAAQAAALIAPELPALPVRLDVACLRLGTTPEHGAVPACPAQQNRARAPPFVV